jgi:type I restriction enzyme S subunit
MTTEILKNLEIIIPFSKTLQEFDGVAGSFYAEVEHAKRQSRSLAALRDALLPKLMSGEIDVEKVKLSA